MLVAIDTREKQEKNHIKDYLKMQDIPFVITKLNTADYGVIGENGKVANNALIELKSGGFVELSTNIFSSDKVRFTAELEKIKALAEQGAKVLLVIEDDFFNLLWGHYYSNVNGKTMFNTLIDLAFQYKFIPVIAPGAVTPWIIETHLHHNQKDQK